MSKFISLIKVYFTKKILTIFVLGFASGMPLALTASVLKVWLLESGINIKMIGLFALVGIPYNFKFVWAPLIDNFKIPLFYRFGRRKSWLILTQIGLVFSLIALGYYGSLGQLEAISFCAVLIAFFSASQDIVIDAYRVEILKDNEQGIGASVHIYGYRIAMLVSTAGTLFLAEIMQWGLTYLMLAIIMSLLTVVSIFIKEPAVQFAIKNDQGFFRRLVTVIFNPFIDFMKKEKWINILLFVIFFKFCDAFIGNLTTTFLRDIGFTKNELAMVVQSFGFAATLIGVFLGGLAVKSMNLVKALWISGILQAVSNLVFILQYRLGTNILCLFFTIGIENITGGIGTSVFLSFLAVVCNKKYTATQFALLTSFAAVGRTFLSSSAGYFVNALGWENFFLVSLVATVPSFIFLYLITKDSNNKVTNA
jgi:MFS transporter, PAT family, beta-lactamase induction signal transducer AmpG